MIAVTFALPNESSEFVRRRPDAPVLHTGVGKDAVQRSLPAFLDQHSPRMLVSAGFAGAVTDSWEVGDAFIAENFSDGSMSSAISLPKAKLATVARVADARHERRASSADAIDMETEFIAAECARRGVPMLSLRAISDTPAAPFGIPADVLFDVERQRTDVSRLIRYLVRHPRAFAQLFHVARQVKIARRSLTAALCAALDALSGD